MEDRRPTANKRQKRRPVACERCHSQKIKCNEEQPCHGCLIAKRPESCRYPFRDRNVTVTESYLEKLEREVEELNAKFASQSDPALSHSHDQVAVSNDPDVPNPLLDSGDGLFAGQESAQPVFVGEASCTKFGDRLLQCVDRRYSTVSCNTMPNHVTHPAFNRLLNKEFQLPNRVQANLLVRRADSFIGSNYHLFERKTFFHKLDRAYNHEESTDVLFACQLFAVLALGELYSTCKATPSDNSRSVPGASWFIQAVTLLQDLYEVSSVEQVQILLLLSFYANALGRIKTAHVYCGIALRLAIGLGLHRSQSGTNTMDPVQRESRRRTWWTLYLFDRLISSKLGYPLGIHDEDIDVEYPSMDRLSATEQREFSDPVHLCSHIRLARIAGDILSDIYCLPQHKRGTFVRRVHRVLNDLRRWDEELAPSLRLQNDGSPRTLFTLHMQYHLCIIQTTRPILLHIFKSRIHADHDPAIHQRTFSPTTLALADACVQAARTTNQLLSKLFVEGSLAVFGYFDAHYLFSSTLILIISAVMEPTAALSDAVQTAFGLLRAMANNGNVSANDYINRLEHIRTTVGGVRANSELQHHAGSTTSLDSQQTRPTHPNLNQHTAESQTMSFGANWSLVGPSFTEEEFNSENPLGNPFVENFLADPSFQWPGGVSPEQDLLRQFAYELGDDLLFPGQ